MCAGEREVELVVTEVEKAVREVRADSAEEAGWVIMEEDSGAEEEKGTLQRRSSPLLPRKRRFSRPFGNDRLQKEPENLPS